MINRIFLDHPAKVDETFFEHMLFAGEFAGKLFAAGGQRLCMRLFLVCLKRQPARL